MSNMRRKSSKMTLKSSGSVMKKKMSLKVLYKHATEEKMDEVAITDELLDDIETDHFIYGLQDEMVSKALTEIFYMRCREEKIREFVDGFCAAWLKLIKWRWMSRDDKDKNVKTHDPEPTICPKDPWSAHCYNGGMEEKPRTTLPPPRRCCPHPPLQMAQDVPVDTPTMEKLRRIRKRKVDFRRIQGEKTGHKRSIMPKLKTESHGMSAIQRGSGVPKTAFPERANTRVFMGAQLAAKKKKGAPVRIHVSQVNIAEKVHFVDDNNKQSQQYSRLDI